MSLCTSTDGSNFVLTDEYQRILATLSNIVESADKLYGL